MQARALIVLAVVGAVFVSFATCEDDDDEPTQTATTDAVEGDAPTADEENDVLVLTQKNFDDIVYTKALILVEFYAPWCGHCKQLAPEFEKAAKRLKENDPPVALAKVDATVESDLGSRFDVSGYPTLKWFKDGKAFDYDGPRDANGIVTYMQQRASASWQPPPEEVVVLTKDNFTEVTTREELMVVMFYAPWCGHCKRMLPEYEKAAQEIKQGGNPILFAKTDATAESELASQYSVSGYPTMKIFRKGRVYDFKSDAREKRGIMEYMESQRGVASKEITTLELVKKHLAKPDVAPVTVVAFFSDTTENLYKLYTEAANEIRDDYKFVHTFDVAARDHFKAQPGSVLVLIAERFQTKHEPKWYTLQLKEDTAASEIVQFVQKHNIPLVGEYNSNTKDKVYKDKRPLVLCFYTVDWTHEHKEATQSWRLRFADIAKQFPELTFAIADEDEHPDLFKEFGFDDSGEEVNIAILGVKDKKYPMPSFEEYDAGDFKAFLKKFLKGDMKAKVKSQPVPQKQGAVTVVVGKTFDKVVLDTKKDVLIELYAPWCGHCKQLEPIYKDLAKKMKKEKNLVIAKMDATANDSPENFSSSGYPTIYFAPSNAKSNPILYSGERKLEDFEKFLEKHATVSLGKRAGKDEL